MQDNNNRQQETRKWLYESLSGNGYDLGSYEDFDKHADEKETREWLYNAGKKSGLELGSYADFDKGMGYVSSSPTSVAQQVIDEYDQANQSSMTTAPVLNDNSVSPQRQLNQSSGEAEKTLFADYVREQLGNIDNELNKPREALPMPAGSAFIPSTAVAAAQRYGNVQTREQQDRYTSLRAARNFLDEANKLVTEAGKKGKTNFVAGALRGLRDKGFDPDTWTMGITETAYYDLLRQAAEKEERGEQLSAEEQQLLDAAAVNMAANAYYAQDLGRGYKAGAVTAESIPFMLQFALNPVSGAGKGIAKTILEHGIKRFGLNTAKRTAAGRAVRGAARMAGDAVAAAGVTATTGLGNVAEDASRRMTGDVQFAEDADGNIRYAGRENNVGTGEAIARAFTSTFFENQSEMVGNYFAPVMRGVSGLVKRLPGIKQLSASKVGEIYRGIKNNPTYKEFTDRTQWHGAIGEYAEEVYNNLASVAMGDMTPEELVDLDNNIDTFLGVGLMSAVFGGIGAAGFARDRYTLNRDVKRFESGLTPDEMERWQEVKRVAQSGDVEGVREFVKYTLRDDSLTPQEKKDEIKYIYDVMQQSAMENVAAEQTEEAVQAETDDIVANSDPQTNTYTECSRLVMNEVGEMVEVPGHIVGYMGGQPLWKPDGAGPEVEAVALKEGEYNPESVRSMPMQEVIDETAQAIREDAAAQAQRESTYSPDIVPPSIGATFTDGAAQYKIAQQNPDNSNGGWLATRTTVDEKGKPKEEVVEITDEQYYNAMQAQIDAQEQQTASQQATDGVSTGNGRRLDGTGTQQPLTPQQQEVETFRQAGVDEEVIRNTIADRVKKAKVALDKAERQAKAPVKEAKTVKEEMAARKKALDEARAVYEGWNALLSPEPVLQVQQTQEDAGARRLPQGRSLAPEEADALLADMESRAEVAPELELTIENWDAQFGADALVQTPIGEVKMGENQFAKMMRQGRNGKLGMVKPTLENPDAIIEEKGGNVDENAVERTSSYIFVKAFAKPDGGRYYYFTSVTVSKDGREVVISNQEKSQKRISKLLRQNPVAWINDKFSSHPITQIEGSVPLSETNKPTQTDNRPALLGVNSPELSEDKGTNHSAKKQASAVETIPTDEKGRPLYHRASVDTTLANINSKGLTPDEVDAFVQANKDAAAKLLKKEEDKAPKMVTDLDKYVADKAAWQSRVSEAHAQVDYWNQVADAIAAQRTQVGDTTAEDILAMGEPMNGYELAAQMLATGKLPLLQSDFKRETGYKRDEARALFGLFASEANGGMTIERAGEQLMLADQEAGTNFFDQSEPNAGRNAILDVLSEVRTRGDLTNYIRRNREAMAERERQAEYDAYADWCDREMHMTPEEYEAYQEYVAANNPYEGVPVAELDRIFAEAEEEIQTYLNQQDNGQQGTSENGSSPDSGPSERDEPAGAAEGREAGVSVLPEAQPVLPGQVQGRAEGTASQPGTADDGVRAEEGAVSEGASGGEGITSEEAGGGASGVEARPVVSQEVDANALSIEDNFASLQSNQSLDENGTISEPVPQGEHRAEAPQDSGMEEAAVELRKRVEAAARDAQASGRTLSERQQQELEQRAAESYAKEKGLWIPMSDTFAWQPMPSGNENNVYLNTNDGHVYKVNNLMGSKGILPLFERIRLHNQLFPESKYDFVGFTGFDNGSVYPVFRQEYVHEATFSTPEEIDSYMQSLGFHQTGEAEYSNNDITISDLRPRNVLKDSDGDLYVIDADFHRNEQTGYVAPERQEDESLLDYAERVVKAKEIDDARKGVSANPTDAQKEAGNYRKGHITLDGYDITIENPKGSTRSGVDANGQPWSVTMNNDYGYIRGTEGVDGDHIDVFLSDDPTTGKVYVIDQVNDDGAFDEHKVMYGFKSALAAKRAYLANYSPGWQGLGSISEVSKEEFKKWVESSHRKTKPFAEYKSVKVDGAQNDTIKTHQPNALPGRLMKAYESGDTALIASVEQEMREFVNSANDMRSVYSTYLRSKDLERAMEKGSPSNKTQHFIAETCKDVLKKAGLPTKAMQSERARTEIAGSMTDPHVLDIMSADTSFNVLRAIIHNPNTSESTLKHFTKVFSNNGLDYEAQQELDKRQSQNGDELRFREVDVEERKELVAVHNLSADKLKQAFDLGGFPMPSIAITKADVGHTEFGEISLIFDKESINPTDRRNKVYGEDAWTPTFPAVGYKLNDEKTSDIYRRANKTGSLPLFNPVIFHPDNYESYISSVGSEGIVNHFKDDYGAKQLYLSENGNAVEKYEQHEVDKYQPDQISLYEKILKEIGIERIKNERSDALENDVKRLIEEHYNIDLDGMKPFRAKARISNAIHHAIDYAEHGNRKTETDIEATKKKIDERIDPEKFEAWLENLFSGVVEKKGIRNDKDMFTPSGSSRKWEQLYDDITLDSVVNAMQRQAARGGQGLFNGSIFGAAQEEYKSIDEIRKEARERIRTMNDAEYKAQRDSITDRLSDIKISGVGNGFSDTMDMAGNIQDAVARSHTAKGIHKYLKGFYPKVTMETANEIADIVKDIQRMSARYFEAKPYRAVGFDEVRLAVVPSDMDKKLVQELEQRGIPVRTYERGNEAQRRQIVEEATDEMNLRFRFIGEQGAARLDKAEEATTRLDNLAVARQMEEEGKNEWAIKLATGWERGADRKWRYETPDFEYTPPEDFEEGKNYNLSDIIKDDELFKAYPKLKGLKFRLEHQSDKYGGGWFDKRKNEIVINTAHNSPWHYEQTIAHEIQHAIQAEEGFEKGDSPEGVIDRYVALQSDLSTADVATLNTAAFIRKRAEKLIRKGEYKYMRWAVRAAMGRLQGRNGMYEEYGPIENLAVSYTAKDLKLAYEKAYEKAHSNGTLFNSGYPTKQSAEFIYIHNAGETEARNVARRLELSLEQRRNMLASETEDVARRDQLFINSALGESASYAPSAEDISLVNERFNEELDDFSIKNADKIYFDLGMPSAELLAAGVENRPIRLHGSKVAKKMKKHGFESYELRNLPMAVAHPIAVFDNLGRDGNRSILTELKTSNGNFLVTIDLGKGTEADFDIVSSVFGKRGESVVEWINKGYMRFVDKEKALDYLHLSAPIAEALDSSKLSDATKIVENFENPIIDSEITRNGSVNLSDDALSTANDPIAKMLGKSTRTAHQRKEFAERERRNMAKRVQELAEKLHLDNVEIVTEPMTITDRQGKTHHPKGFYNPRTGKITVVVPNNVNTFDAEQTLLHEAVAHYGLRQLFGEHFDTFLDNVYNNADVEVRRKIVELAKKNGWNPRLATEEYLASLAEETNFEDLDASWWRKIKELFLRMLHKIGFNDFNGVTLSDNELRYILWRSYENLSEPGRYRSILGEAADIVKQNELKVGNYASVNENMGQVADARESAKAERIQKLRDSKPVEITGNEIEAGDDLKQYKKNALEYGKKLRASYQNKDTGITVQLGKTGVKEVLNHDYKNVEQLQSIAAIPQIIENSIYIDSQKNTDPEKNRDVSMYHYYVCGLKIGNTDYTVRAVIAEQPNGNRYYDHKLTQIEKGKLLDSLSGITTPGFNQKTSLISDIKDTKLFSILQTNNEENLLFRESTEENQGQNATDDMNDESPSPISTPTVQAWDKLMNSFGFQFSETSFDHLAAVEEFQKLVEKHSGKEIKSFENAYDQMIALSSKTKNEMEMFDSFILTPMNKAILKLVGEKPVLKRWSWDKDSLRDLAVYVEAKHGVERNRQMAVEKLAKDDKSGESILADWSESKKRINSQQNLSWIKRQQMLDEEAGKLGADLSKDYSGLSSIFKDKEKYKDGWNTAALKYVEEYEKSHPQEDIDGLWKSVELATDYALQKQYESGLVSKEYVERQKERFENYVPLRGFADEIAGDVYNYMGNEFYAGGNPVKTASGRTSEAGNPFGSILNIAYSSMAVGNKNMAKLALYSLIVNHDTGGLAIPGHAWMVKYDELKNNKELSNLLVSPEIANGEETPEWVEAVPQFPEKATSEEITRAMNNFEEAMKVYQKKGDAKPIGKRAKMPYRTLYKERDQHDIPLFIAGDKYVITVTGNPRLAQAMNGLLNPDVNNDPVSVIGKKIQRFMAGAFTAQNASFAVANLSRDTIYANNQAFIRENFRYWWKFTKNQHLGFGDYPQMMKRLHKYRHNQLDMNNKTDRLFKEFMENGGATGYTFINDQDEYAHEIAKQMKKLSGKTPSYITPQGALKLMFDGIEFAGQSAELVNRFAAYKTSREMGRPISRSVRDAKEITVNFNRKGAGMKTAKVNRSTEGKGLIAGFRPIDFVACLSQLGRSHIIFWNANMQGKRRTYLNFKEHPVKTTITLVANNLVLGAVVLPFLNNVVMPALYDLVGWSSGDDDEDYYDALTDWERTKNLCLRLPHGYWLKIPMAPDMSPWLSMGDAIGGSLTGKRELTYSDFAKSLVDVASPISINWSYGSNYFGLNFVPSIAQPYLQNMMNVNFMGNPIYKTPFNARQGFIPEYKMVYRSTSPTLIELSRVSNLVTGGSDIKTSGGADWNPAVLQNMISGYTGGWGNTMLSIADLMLNTLKGEETSVAMSQVPLVSRFVISGNKDMQLRRVNSSFYKVKDFINEFEYDRKSLEDAIRESGKEGNMLEVAKYQDELNQLFNSARCQKYVKLKAIEKGVKSYEEWLNETPNDEMMQDMVIGLKKEGIEELNR